MKCRDEARSAQEFSATGWCAICESWSRACRKLLSVIVSNTILRVQSRRSGIGRARSRETVDGAKAARYAPPAMKVVGARWSFSARPWCASALAVAACGGSTFSGSERFDAAGPSDSPAAPDAGLANRGAVLEDGPIVYWRMGIGSGSVVPDESGHHNDLLLQGTGHRFGVAGAIAGDPDGAIGFDGANGH